MHCNWLPGITFVMAVIAPSGKSPYMFYYTSCNADTTSLAKTTGQPLQEKGYVHFFIVLSVDSDLHRFSAVTPGGLAPTSRILALSCSLLRAH